MMLLFSLFCLVTLTAVEGRECRSVLPYNKLKNVRVMRKSDLLPKNCFVCETEDCSTVTVGVENYLTRRVGLFDAGLPSFKSKLTLFAAAAATLSPMFAAAAAASSFLVNRLRSLTSSDVGLTQTLYSALHQKRELEPNKETTQDSYLNPTQISNYLQSYMSQNKPTMQNPYYTPTKISNPLPYMSPNSPTHLQTHSYHAIASPDLTYNNIGYNKDQLIPSTVNYVMRNPRMVPQIIKQTLPVVQHVYLRQPRVKPQIPVSIKYVSVGNKKVSENQIKKLNGQENFPSMAEEEVLQILQDYAAKQKNNR